MQKILKRFAIILLVVFVAFGISLDSYARWGGGFSRGSFGRSSFGRSRSLFGRSSRRSYGGSIFRRSTRRVTTPKSTPSTRRSVSKSYGSSSGRTGYTSRSSAFSRSSAIRQKKQAMSKAKTGTAVSTKGMSSRDKRTLKAQNRKYTRQLKAENRTLKRQVRRADRNTAYERRQRRIVNQTVVNPYPVATYNPLWTMAACMAFNNLYMGIYFHDYYNHTMYHSWLWYYHHPDYDRSHWSHEQEMEYARWRAYYDSQGIQPNANYVDPDTHKDEDYTQSYVDQNPDKFYGPNAEEYTVDKLPDESEVPQLISTSGKEPITSQMAQNEPRTIVVKQKTSGAVWFVLIFGAILIVGIIALVMYNRGYF